MTAGERVLRGLAPSGWLVGGAVRDRLLGREVADLDVTVAGDPAALAREVARQARGHAFALSDAFGAWRAVARDRSWQLDVVPLAGETIDADLARRDFTVGAIAEPLAGGELVDPFGGRADLAAGRLRMVTPEAFAADPLRCLRLARLACELALTPDPATLAAARAAAPGLAAVSSERVFGELKRIVTAPAALAGLAAMESAGATREVFPELLALRGVAQSRFHHLDVYDHTLAALARAIELEADPAPAFGEHAGAVRALLAEALADELTRGAALRFGALLHDIAKPATRVELPDGRIGFPGHDTAGAATARAILGRWRASDRLADHVGALTRHHLRLGFLVHRAPLSRADVYGYLDATGAVGVDVTVLSVADRLATLGDNHAAAVASHLALAREMAGEGLAWRAAPPRPPLRGDELAAAVGLAPGPELGALLAELERAAFTGEVTGAEDAIAFARARLAGR